MNLNFGKNFGFLAVFGEKSFIILVNRFLSFFLPYFHSFFLLVKHRNTFATLLIDFITSNEKQKKNGFSFLLSLFDIKTACKILHRTNFYMCMLKTFVRKTKQKNQQDIIIIINRLHVELHQIHFLAFHFCNLRCIACFAFVFFFCFFFFRFMGCNQIILHSQVCLIEN